jgi:hypothetical protein
VLKFDKYGRPLLGWGMKGTGPGQFDTPHTIVIDGDLVYVGDRENARIQIFDRNGQFLRQWSLGHPFGLVITADHILYMGDAIAGRILKIDPQGRVLGSFTGPQPGQGLTSIPTKSRSHPMDRYLPLKFWAGAPKNSGRSSSPYPIR